MFLLLSPLIQYPHLAMPTVQSILLSVFGIFLLQLLLRLRRVAHDVGSVWIPSASHWSRQDSSINSKLPFQLPLWSILPFQPTFRCRIHTFKNDPEDSLYTHGKYLGAQKETRRCVYMMNDAAWWGSTRDAFLYRLHHSWTGCLCRGSFPCVFCREKTKLKH